MHPPRDPAEPSAQAARVRSAIRVSVASVGFGAVVGVSAFAIGLATRSLALLGFSVDAIVDLSASILLIHRFRAESRGHAETPRLERRALGFISVLLVLAGIYVGMQSVLALASGARPERTLVGLGIAAASLVVLPGLAYWKARVARELPSRALRADAFLTGMGAILAGLALTSAMLEMVGGPARADAIAAFAIAVVLVAEGVRGLIGIARSP